MFIFYANIQYLSIFNTKKLHFLLFTPFKSYITPNFDNIFKYLIKIVFTRKIGNSFLQNARQFLANGLKGLFKMQNCLLKPLILKIKEQDMAAFPLIFDEFKKLINFYGAKLGYEDAASELTLFLIELLYEINIARFPSNSDEDIHKYIAASIKNKYIALSRAKLKNTIFENELWEDCCGYTEDFDCRFCFTQGVSCLNSVQRKIIIYHYVYGYSIAEIAKLLGVTRQAVNRSKNQALVVLRRELCMGEDMYI